MSIRKPLSLTFLDKLYIPAIIKGLMLVLKHFFRRKKFTVQYPEQKPVIYPNFRGEHKINLDEQGRVTCVACFLCETACPAQCIHIEAEESPWPDREKIPTRFDIDMLRCIYCGMCEEACPEDAIAMTNKLYKASYSREDMIYDLDRLVENGKTEKDIFPKI